MDCTARSARHESGKAAEALIHHTKPAIRQKELNATNQINTCVGRICWVNASIDMPEEFELYLHTGSTYQFIHLLCFPSSLLLAKAGENRSPAATKEVLIATSLQNYHSKPEPHH